jgi:uncharacterized protein (TIRG00374 family)
VLGFAADAPRLLHLVATFPWQVLPVILGLTVFNYLLRFAKWHYYLGVVGIRGVPIGESAMIFTAGLSMTLTPGKIGEFLKSYLLQQQRGTPIATSAPIIVAERLTDGVALLILASGGLIGFGVGWQMLLPIFGAILLVLVVSKHRGLTRRMLDVAERLPFLAKRLPHLEAALNSAYQLFGWRALVIAVWIGVISWGGEAAGFYVVLTALGLPPSATLAIQSAFILAASSLVGAASLLPGGLAAAEGTLAGLLLLLGVTDDPAVAAAATLIIRFATLWFGVVVGLVGLAIVASRLRGIKLPAPESERQAV